MTITLQTLITAAAVLAALTALLTSYNRAYGWFCRQRRQDEDIRALKDEQSLLTCGVLACLKGLQEQGCNGPVTEAIIRLEAHINQQAHK